jgi:hypothetical protein
MEPRRAGAAKNVKEIGIESDAVNGNPSVESSLIASARAANDAKDTRDTDGNTRAGRRTKSRRVRRA